MVRIIEKKIIGILGGMGPLATADLFRKIILHTNAACDQDHLRVIIDNNTSIPDRTDALLHGGQDPTPALVASAQLLERYGAQLLVIPCNTSHHFYDAIQASVAIPVLHMIRITAQALQERGVGRAGLLATSGTVRTGIYQQGFANTGITLLTPPDREQETVMDVIYQIKAGHIAFDGTGLQQAVDGLLRRGAETIILGCTELPLMLEQHSLECPVTDPTLEVALEAIRLAGGGTV